MLSSLFPRSAMPTPSSGRPSLLRSVQSFRVERSSSPPSRTRSKTTGIMDSKSSLHSAIEKTDGSPEGLDTFESRPDKDPVEDAPRVSVDLDDLPIELITLIDRFIDSLSAPIHPHPPNIDNLSRMFQDFYATASSHIQTHLDSLATLQKRDSSQPPPPQSSSTPRPSLLPFSVGRDRSASKQEPPEQPLLTQEELAEQKRLRRAREQQKAHLEEAVERRLCEGIYAKIYRHRSTQDEAQDAKLRSKTAALAVVGIGLGDLGVQIDPPSPGSGEEWGEGKDRAAEVREWLEGARKELVLMTQARYPLGKLEHLKRAHKRILDTLAHFHPSSSADELMPMLIYTLVTMPPEQLHVVSDAAFVRRFRWEQKLVGEAAYCLTNLEAAISFLETVDLSTLREDETPTGPLNKPGISQTQLRGETFPPAFSTPTKATDLHSVAEASLTAALKQQQQLPQQPPPATGLHSQFQHFRSARRLSDLPAQALNAASDAVWSTADQGLKTIGMSLGGGYKFLVGKLRGTGGEAFASQGAAGSGSAGGGSMPTIPIPRTLDDARRLLGTPLPPIVKEEQQAQQGQAGGSNLLGLISGTARRMTPSEPGSRERSVESQRGTTDGSGAVGMAEGTSSVTATGASSTATATSPSTVASTVTSPPAAPSPAPSNTSNTSSTVIDSVRNLGSTLNPIGRISAAAGLVRGFTGRASPAPAASPAALSAPLAREPKEAAGSSGNGSLAVGSRAERSVSVDSGGPTMVSFNLIPIFFLCPFPSTG